MLFLAFAPFLVNRKSYIRKLVLCQCTRNGSRTPPPSISNIIYVIQSSIEKQGEKTC